MARMRHPNLLNFLGLCTLPPCIITGAAQQGCAVWGFNIMLVAVAAHWAWW